MSYDKALQCKLKLSVLKLCGVVVKEEIIKRRGPCSNLAHGIIFFILLFSGFSKQVKAY